MVAAWKMKEVVMMETELREGVLVGERRWCRMGGS
jgi:hypothetical protein